MLLDEEARRRINQAHFRRTMAVIAVLSTLGVLVGIYLSPLFRVQHVEVQGTVNLQAADIEELVGGSGDSMFSVDVDTARQRIEEKVLVKSASIERDWPNTLKVTIAERVPWAAWKVGEATYIIDAEGRVLPALPAPAGPVILHLDATNSPAEGEHVDTNAVRLAALLLQHVPPRLQLGITTMEWSTVSGMTIATDAGYRVVVGDEDDLNYKLSVWAEIDSTIGRQEMSGHVLDLRFGDRPSLQ
jgi:cell division protein FtsQ